MPSLRTALKNQAKATRRQKALARQLRSINKELEQQLEQRRSFHQVAPPPSVPEQDKSRQLTEALQRLEKQLLQREAQCLSQSSQISKLEGLLQKVTSEKAALAKDALELRQELEEARQQSTQLAESLQASYDELQEASKGQRAMALVCQVLQEEKGPKQVKAVDTTPQKEAAVFQTNACYEEDDDEEEQDDVTVSHSDQLPRDAEVTVHVPSKQDQQAPKKAPLTPSATRIPRAPGAVTATTTRAAQPATKTTTTDIKKEPAKPVVSVKPGMQGKAAAPSRTATSATISQFNRLPKGLHASGASTPATGSACPSNCSSPDVLAARRRSSTGGAATGPAATTSTSNLKGSRAQRLWL